MFTGKRAPTLGQDLDRILVNLSLMGFCTRLTGEELIARYKPLTPDDFAMAVLVAEGFTEPLHETRWLRQFRQIFINRYGHSVTPETYSVDD